MPAERLLLALMRAFPYISDGSLLVTSRSSSTKATLMVCDSYFIMLQIFMSSEAFDKKWASSIPYASDILVLDFEPKCPDFLYSGIFRWYEVKEKAEYMVGWTDGWQCTFGGGHSLELNTGIEPVTSRYPNTETCRSGYQAPNLGGPPAGGWRQTTWRDSATSFTTELPSLSEWPRPSERLCLDDT